jgi:asparagine synthase (glutamine-hydrolysing)
MTSIMRHRGPDDAGIWTGPAGSGAIGLGHRRLSIIDLTAAGHQPMANEDDTWWLTYNGEIYNHRDVRRDLQAAGHRYHSETDSETIIHAHEEWGDAAVQRFRGMFAYGLWDSRRERLTLVRDRLGVKPLYYAVTDTALLFGSEVKALLSSGLVKARPDLDAVSEYLAFGFIAGDGTMFQGIRKLPPGHILTWEKGRIRIERYWEIRFEPVARSDEPAQQERLAELFQESVQLRLMSDVPLGVFLSGGLDSSAIAAVTARFLDRPLQTFSVGFESRYYSEFSYAREVAAHVGADHHEVVLTGQSFFDAVPRLTWHEDEPLWGTASVALYAVSELARQHVTVVLTGEGSDELFAGYDRYWMTALNAQIQRWYRLLPASARALLRRGLLSQAVPERLRRSLGHTIIRYESMPDGLVLDNWFGVFPPEWQEAHAGPVLRAQLAHTDARASRRAVFDEARGKDLVDRFLELDVKTSLVELLMKQDQMSMATSIESRVPFLDHKLVEFAASLPASSKIRGFSGKQVVKDAFRSILPGSIIDRRKMGFPVPWEQWLREPFMDAVETTLTEPRTQDRGWLEPAAVVTLVGDHKSRARNNARQLWNLWGLELWARAFVDGDAPEGPDAAPEELASHAAAP